MVDITQTRILYMEDDPGISVLLQKSLERRGFRVDTATNGEEGLKMAAEASYDVLLVDYNMPFLGGLDVIRELSRNGPGVPIIMVTGDGNEEVAVEALKLGASDYIVKDVEMRYLKLIPAVIDRVLSQQQLIRERNQMQETVRESEERYRRLVELSPDGIAVHIEGKFVFLNPAGAHQLGASTPDQLVGTSVFAVVHPEFQEIARSRVQQVSSTKESVNWIEERFVRLDGTVIDVEVASVYLPFEGKQAVQTIFRDITDRKRIEQRLEQLALYDTLTGLPNRTLFYDRMNQLLALAKRNDYVLALLYVDLDRFKEVNDRRGHEVGDLVLKEAAQRMTSCTRRSDTVARMGGDEFVGICGRIASQRDAGIVAEKLISALAMPFHIRERDTVIGASIGISLYPNDGDDVETLVAKADQAMYRVKATGKGGYLFFSDIPV
ncbi:MAG TPA: diguanylate cyclase [Nitrospirota bacterium]|nr:diguanylate cyclase [Nitrospirota bacterium]